MTVPPTLSETAAPFFSPRHRVSARRLLVVVASALIVVTVSSLIAHDGDVPGWEEAILRWFNGWPDILEAPLWVVQQVGVFGAPVVVGLVIVGFTRRWDYLIPFVLVLPLKMTLEKGVVKQFVDRERPYVSVGTDINVRGPAYEGLCFPSGHCTTAFAIATLLVAFVPPRWRPLPIAWAIAVAATRLYYGEHNPLDVVAGAALGIAFATVLWFIFVNRWVSDGPTGQEPAR